MTITMIDRAFNPWNMSLYFAALAAIVFVADASVRLWRRGGRRRALVIGGSITFFILAASVHTALVSRRLVHTPNMVSWVYLSILVAMTSELNADVLGAARLAGQLQVSERHMDLASAAVDMGLWAWDIVDDTFWATSRARVLFGFSESERINFARFQSALHPEDSEAVERSVESALSSGRSYEAEYSVHLPEGPVRWIAARGQLEHDAKGKPLRLRGVVIDVTARRGNELELQQLRSQLAHASRVSMMGQLASALAHELSQPLGAILRNAEAAELFLEHDPPDLDELLAILADIRQDDQRAGNTIERLRALLKRRSFAPRALSVSDELEYVAALARGDSVARGVVLEFAAASDLPMVMGDSVHLQQVLLNLVLNAMDAVEDVAAARRKVTVRAKRHGASEVEVAVEDHGVGIAPEKLGRLFEPFFTTKPNGLGIGLSISRTIIEAHGGRIWAENNAEAGATFRFTLPVTGGAAPS